MKHLSITPYYGQVVIMILSCITLSYSTKSFASDTTHTRILYKTVVTDPSKGMREYSQHVVFPSANKPVRKITLYVTLSCPDSMRCADWDYSDQIILKRKDRSADTTANYTIAHFLTPYGGAFSRTWSFRWEVDVTDFSLLLRDSAEISYVHSGYEENKDRGWKIELDFCFIGGTPAAEALAIHKVYSGNYQYGNQQHPIEDALHPYQFLPGAKTRQARLYVLQTGHGMDSADCGEFCSRFREIWWNGQLVSKKDIWKKCGDNPLYPQAGTWLFNRANWCPGYLNQPEVLDEKIARGKENEFHIHMEPYVTKDANVNENIFAYIIEYQSPHAQNDVSLEDVIVPSNVQLYGRKNPACLQPVVLIKNNGSSTLSSCTIRYGTSGFPLHVFHWKGKLEFNQAEEVLLPGNIDFKTGSNQYIVELSNPNGKKDSYPPDNKIVSAFNGVPLHGRKIIVQLHTNNKAQDNSYTISNSSGQVVFNRSSTSLKADTVYQDTLNLQEDCYRFEFSDTAGNGLEFWYAVKDGRGTLRLLNEKGEMIKNFESDFGNRLQYDFRVTSDSSLWTKPSNEIAIGAFPTMTTGKVALDYFSNNGKELLVQLVSDGGENEVVEEHQYHSIKQAKFTYDLSYRPAQRYYIKVYADKQLVFTKRLRVVAKLMD